MPCTLVVGANRGIGLELTRQLQTRKHSVIATCRRPSEELNALDVEVVPGVDITQDEGIDALRNKLEGRMLDGVIVVAGVLLRTSLDALDVKAFRTQFEVNALGPLRVASALRTQINQGGRFAILTSRMGSLADNTSGGAYGYRMSKAAVNMAGVSLAHDLKAQGIIVALLHPGYVKTEMTGGMGHITAKESATLLLDRYEDLSIEKTGTFLHANGETLPW